jgi:acyl phosphate:glycerol-3-phosphate acyltransferase
MLQVLILIAAAYLIGSIPFSWLVARRAARLDIRKTGSGNVGATNVLRSVGKRAGILALLLDGSKGWVVVYLARLWVESEGWPFGTDGATIADSPSFWFGLAALVAVIGHMFPLWLRFQGGKGVATAAGAYLGIDPTALLLTVAAFVLVVSITRYVSVGSIVAAAVFPLFVRFLTGGTTWEIVFTVLIGILVIVKHHNNMTRILRGEERKFP